MKKNTQAQASIDQAKHLLNRIEGNPQSPEERSRMAIELAGHLIDASEQLLTSSERRKQQELHRMMRDRRGKAFTMALTDQCFRAKSHKRIADQMRFLLSYYGIPKYLSPIKRLQLFFFKRIGHLFPNILVPLAIFFLRKQTSDVIIPGEKFRLRRHIHKRKKEKIRLNINHLGEAILGEGEANRRLDVYLNALQNPDIDYVSVKISTIYSQITLLKPEYSIEKVSEKLRLLYRAAMQNPIIHSDGKQEYKFVNLDMEEYKDLHLTKNVFMQVLDEEEFLNYSAGIVLQAYLPDAIHLQKELTEWAIRRRKKGGAPIKIRLVKGANMTMEQFEASARGWPQAPYRQKVESDANYKQMMLYGIHPERADAVNLGIASHNIFDIAYAFLLRSEQCLEDQIQFEMLEGMANHLRRVVHELSGSILLYCAVATRKDFQSAIAYLIRRLDENTGAENFLAHSFGMVKDSTEWKAQVEIFKQACSQIETVSTKPRRTQDRNHPPHQPDPSLPFFNEPDTDFSLPQNQKCLAKIAEDAKQFKQVKIPISIGEKEVFRADQEGFDPSKPEHIPYTYTWASAEELQEILKIAKDAEKQMQAIPYEKRIEIIQKFARIVREKRVELITEMVVDGGKNPQEADVEISEAIDFAEYYSRSLRELYSYEDVSWSALGTMLITPPWNFPFAIPCGGAIASFLTGNATLFKPAQETALIGYRIAQMLWEAGVPKNALQFLLCQDDPEGSRLIQDERINGVILTGATETAKLFHKLRPGIHLNAETGGKNSMIITSLADKDIAIKELIHSAFGHAGQKCSAASIAILEKEVYDDPHFMKMLKEAAESLHVGSAYAFENKVTPLILPAKGALERGLTQLDPGEQWLLEPQQDPSNPRLWSPGIKIHVQENSYTHKTEFFGPVLALMRAENLDHAIRIANAVPYGLTSGIQSLDVREVSLWKKSIMAGNLYINRGITGAIVRRQPFGGCKESSFGSGHKAGGPNYLTQFMYAKQVAMPKNKHRINDWVNNLTKSLESFSLSQDDLGLWLASIASYSYWHHRFKHADDPSLIVGQDNLFEYHELKHMFVRIEPEDKPIDFLRIFAAALSCGTPLNVSWEKAPSGIVWHSILPLFNLIEESQEEFIKRLEHEKIKRVRMLSKPSKQIQQAASIHGTHIDHSLVMANGRIELVKYLREVAISHDYHRYGNLGTREGESRAPIL